MFRNKKEIVNARKINKMRWIAGIIMSFLVIAITTISLTLNIADFYNENYNISGLGTLRMFTTLSNILAMIAAFMCLPFQIDGLKRDKYKLPPWIITLLYIGTTGTFLTFFMAITLLSITQGFVIIMFQNSNLFMHTLNPLFITLLFILILSDVHIKFSTSFLTLIPVTIYSFIYFIMVFVVKSWDDVYQANTFIPWPVTLILVIAITFGLSQLLRVLHNLVNNYVTKNIRRYYLETSDFDYPLVSDAIRKLAQIESKFYYEGSEIYIPVDIIALLSERYSASKVPTDILYDIYLESYLINIKKKNIENSNKN